MANVVTTNRRRRYLLGAGALQDAILNSPSIAGIATDANGVIQILSAGAQRMLGYTEAELADKRTLAQLSDPVQGVERARALSLEFATAIAPGLEALAFKAARGMEDRYELTWIRKDGSRLPALLSVTALRDARSEVIGYLLITTDNSAEEGFRRMVEALTDCGIVQLDAQGQVLSWNAGAQILDGYSTQEIVGQHVSRFYCCEDVEQGVPQRDLEAAAATGRYETEGWRARKDGSVYRANIVLTSLYDQAGVLRGFARLSRATSEPKAHSAGSPKPAREAQVASVPRRGLLYVEDHGESFALVEQLVARRADMALMRAASVDLGIALARSTRPEVILLNIDLPGIGALQFLKLLRTHPATQTTPLLALGASAAPEAVTQALVAGFFHYLTKPLKPEPFLEALNDALEFAALERAEQHDRAFTSAHSH